MSRSAEARAAERLLPGIRVEAAGVFGVQDRGLATGLLGEARTALGTESGAAVAAPVLVAVSSAAVHIADWDHRHGPRAEVARFDRAALGVALESYADARRLTLTDLRSGYRLPLTATVSRWNRYGAGARSVIERLTAAKPHLDGTSPAV